MLLSLVYFFINGLNDSPVWLNNNSTEHIARDFSTPCQEGHKQDASYLFLLLSNF